MPLYLKFFESIAAKLNGFLRRFQSDAPMVPFLVNTLEEITREFCSKFILVEVMGNSTNTIQLIKIDVFDINKQKVNVDLGFAIKEEINLMKKNGKIKETKLMEFYKAVKKFLATLCNHLLTKTSLQYQCARCCRCLNPHFMSENQSLSKNLFNLILEKLVSSHHFAANQANNAKSQYTNFLQLIVNRNHSSFSDFNVDESRLDEFLMLYLESCSRLPQLSEIAKFIMVLPHGQSASERGFSANKNLLVENLQEKSIECQRIVVDYMRSNGFQSYEVPITQKLIKCVKEPHARYVNDLAERKKKSLNEERSKNLESLNESIRTLHQKKNLLESTIEDLKKASDEYACKAEDGTMLTSVKQLITKSNALKRAAPEKQVELELDQCLKETKELMDKKKDV